MTESKEELKSLLMKVKEESERASFDARYWMLGASALGQPRGMVWGGRREERGAFRVGNTCIPVADSF